MRKRIYIAGPISKGDLCANLDQATAAFVALAKAGFAPLCPHWSVYSKPASERNHVVCCEPCRRQSQVVCHGCQYFTEVWCEATVMGNDEMAHADWMGVDLPWVECAHAVLRLPGESTGADLEVAHARKNAIPVFISIDGLVAHFDRAEAA